MKKNILCLLLAGVVAGLLGRAPASASAQAAAPKNAVLIVGGTVATEILYLVLEGRLRGDGYSVEFFELPGGGKIDIGQSAAALRARIKDLLKRSPTRKVDLITHSQGGIVAKTYLNLIFTDKNTDAAERDGIETVVNLGTPHQGTDLSDPLTDLVSGLIGCKSTPLPPPCLQLKIGSPLLQKIAARPKPDPIYYTNFVSENDKWVTPYMNGIMKECVDRKNAAGETLSCNIIIQKQCPGRFVEHLAMANDPVVYTGIRNALQHRKIVLNCALLL